MLIKKHRMMPAVATVAGLLSFYVTLLYVSELRNKVELSAAQGIGQLVQAAQIIRGQ